MKHRLLPLLCAALLAAGALCVARLPSGEESGEAAAPGKTVEEMLGVGAYAPPPLEYGGKLYRQPPGLERYLLIGVDVPGHVDEQTGEETEDPGRSDVLFAVTLDRERGRLAALQINRDILAEVTVLDGTGRPVGSRTEQIKFAHFYGTGGADSCRNTVEAVSRLLGVEFDGYAALAAAGIPALNDAVGGVSVTIEDDFSAWDPTLVRGETVTLLGEHAWEYLHEHVGGGNPNRMGRHRTYLSAFSEQVRELVRKDAGFSARLWQTAAPYLVTDMGSADFVDLVEAAVRLEDREIVTLTGTYLPDGSAARVDEDGVLQAVLKVFYVETEEKADGQGG